MEQKLLAQAKELTLELYNLDSKREKIKQSLRDIEIMLAAIKEHEKEKKREEESEE